MKFIHMKATVFTLLMNVFSTIVFAQYGLYKPVQEFPSKPLPENPATTGRSGGPPGLYIDYSTINGDNAAYFWPFNNLYTTQDSAINFAAVAFDRIYGYTTYSPPYTILTWQQLGLTDSFPSSQVLIIDTAYVLLSHENNSGQQDYYGLSMHPLNANGELNSAVLWEQTDSTSSSMSPTTNWWQAGSLLIKSYEINYTTNPGERVGLAFKYIDSTKLDTLGLTAGCNQIAANAASQSAFNNSFMRYPPTFPIIGRNANAVVNAGPPIGLAYFLAQNWLISIKAGIFGAIVRVLENPDEEGIMSAVFQDAGAAVFRYKSASDAVIQVHDLSGKRIANMEVPSTGNHWRVAQFPFDAKTGMYIASLLSEGKVKGVARVIMP